jgi:1-acyl-sn-glycerol-3-phosphate acyltransferase
MWKSFLSFLGWLYYKIIGWKVEGRWPEGIDRAVIIVAPHTSNADYLIGVTGLWQSRVHGNVLVKKEAFKGIQGFFLRLLGAIPVNRGNAAHMINDLGVEINKRKTAKVVFAPEGTRKLAKRWKTGFYFTALAAKVPIVITYIDFGTKTAGYGDAIYPTGDIEKDFATIRNWFAARNLKGKYPEQSSCELWPNETDVATQQELKSLQSS